MFVAVATVSVFATALASGVTLPRLSNSVVIDADGVVTAETAAHALALLDRLLTRSNLPSAEPRARAVRSLTHTDACTPALLSILSCTISVVHISCCSITTLHANPPWNSHC
jgi:hypothetical protein